MRDDRSEEIREQPNFLAAATRGWAGSVVLAIAIGVTYFFAAWLSLGLLTEPDGVAVFWPAAGVSSGALIALGRGVRVPVALGTIGATIAANLLGDRNLVGSVCFALCNAAEALITAGLIDRYVGANFSLGRLRHVLGLLAAAGIATTVSGIGATAAYKQFHSPAAPILSIWHHWFASDVVGIIAVAPLVIGLTSVMARPPARSEAAEGAAALIAAAAMTGIIISLPAEPWETVVPAALLFPILLWLAARCGPVFAAAGAFMVSVTVGWTATFGIGHFGDPGLPIDARILQARAIILVATVGAYVLAALFAERKENEARLARSNMMLERERSNKLMSLAAMAAAISHEMKQPLTAVTANGIAAVRLLQGEPPDVAEARFAVDDVVNDAYRAADVLDSLRGLFGKVDRAQEPIDMNEATLAALRTLRSELGDHGIKTGLDLAPGLPRVIGNKGQLQEAITNLIHNAIEAMAPVKVDRRHLNVSTRPDSGEAVIIEVKDSGPGIDPPLLENIFDAFVTTKPHGTGLGLAICRMIAERHGGRLSAMSDGKNGALFQLVLPIRPAETG